MKRIIAAAILVLAAVLFMGPASGHGGITGKYPAPHDVEVVSDTCDSITVEWDNPAHSDFSVVRYSTNSDMSDSDYIRPQDVGSPNDALGDNEVTITGLDDDDNVHIRVGTSDYNGHRLSPYSVKISERTDAVC